jgi:hypothetical protein
MTAARLDDNVTIPLFAAAAIELGFGRIQAACHG